MPHQRLFCYCIPSDYDRFLKKTIYKSHNRQNWYITYAYPNTLMAVFCYHFRIYDFWDLHFLLIFHLSFFTLTYSSVSFLESRNKCISDFIISRLKTMKSLQPVPWPNGHLIHQGRGQLNPKLFFYRKSYSSFSAAHVPCVFFLTSENCRLLFW